MVLASLAVQLAGPVPGRAGKPKPPPHRYLFAGVPWLVPADSARVRLVERDYEHVRAASDSGQIVFRGRMFDHDAVVTGHLDEERRLVRWVVLIPSRVEVYRWPDMRDVYDEVTAESRNRYGPARSAKERYRFPAERGNGREDEALRDGHLTIQQVWESKSGDRLTIEMDATVAVVLTYECREWEELQKRRRAKRASDL